MLIYLCYQAPPVLIQTVAIERNETLHVYKYVYKDQMHDFTWQKICNVHALFSEENQMKYHERYTYLFMFGMFLLFNVIELTVSITGR